MISLANGELSIERARDSDLVIASWGEGNDAYHLSLPARSAKGEVLPGTGVEQLSDLLFWLSNVRPPRVRKSKVREDSDTARLSIRDLLWYCYLDQDDIDSSFFHLEESAPFYKRYKSRDVLRYVIGFHDERVAEIEAELDEYKGKRQALNTAIAGLVRVLREVGVGSEAQINERMNALQNSADHLQAQVDVARRAGHADSETTHATDTLRQRAKLLGNEIARWEDSVTELLRVKDRDLRHLHEIETLSLKFRRSISAKAVLTGVAFTSCPRCAQTLPPHNEECCGVCGQPDDIQVADPTEVALVERDAKSRMAELTDILAKHEESLLSAHRELEVLRAKKSRVERERNAALSSYDSAYLSTMIVSEREIASLQQEKENLAGLMLLPQMVEKQRDELTSVAAQELRLRMELKEARQAAESDAANLDQLRVFFLDCLVRAGVPGITVRDRVEIPTPSFYPEVYGPNPDDHAVTTFSTLSSGGKKTLFKCCFAIAVHRLAVKIGAPLPELLIIDSPMKNISERENREQFEGFYRMLYELKSEELHTTQLVLIDKEFSAPSSVHVLNLIERHMRPGDKANPPLIPYYDGK